MSEEANQQSVTPSEPDAAKPNTASQKLIKIAFPDNPEKGLLVGVCTAILLLLLGLYVKNYIPSAETVANVLFSLTAALILAAFGGQATLRWGPLILAGVAASFGSLLVFLEHTDHKRWERAQQSYIFGNIFDVPSAVYSVDFRRQDDFWINHAKSDVKFLALGGKIDKISSVRLTMTVKDRTKAPFCKSRQADEECEELVFDVPANLFLNALSSKSEIQWRFDPRKTTFVDNNNKKLFGEKTTLETSNRAVPARKAYSNRASWRILFPVAHAKSDDGQLRDALSLLTSDDTTIRRAARDSLSDGPVEWVRPIVDHMRKNYETYRIKLGCSVALAQMLRKDKTKSQDIQSLLSNEDLNLLLKAAADPDRTVRIYASEFLYDLGDPRSVLPALTLAKEADENGKYNLILISKSGLTSLKSKPDRQNAQSYLSSLKANAGEKTKSLIDSALTSIQ